MTVEPHRPSDPAFRPFPSGRLRSIGVVDTMPKVCGGIHRGQELDPPPPPGRAMRSAGLASRHSHARARPGAQYGGSARSALSARKSAAIGGIHHQRVLVSHLGQQLPLALPVLCVADEHRRHRHRPSDRGLDRRARPGCLVAPTPRARRVRRPTAARRSRSPPRPGTTAVARSRARRSDERSHGDLERATVESRATGGLVSCVVRPLAAQGDVLGPRRRGQQHAPGQEVGDTGRGAGEALGRGDHQHAVVAGTADESLQSLGELRRIVMREPRRKRIQIVDHDERARAAAARRRARRRHPTPSRDRVGRRRQRLTAPRGCAGPSTCPCRPLRRRGHPGRRAARRPAPAAVAPARLRGPAASSPGRTPSRGSAESSMRRRKIGEPRPSRTVVVARLRRSARYRLETTARHEGVVDSRPRPCARAPPRGRRYRPRVWRHHPFR